MEASNSGADEYLVHDTEINKQKLMDAVRNDDIETAKELIGKGININFILDCCTPLHAAVNPELPRWYLHFDIDLELRSMDMFELLLSQPNIDLNISDEQLAAPLLWCLEHRYSPYLEKFVLRLIEAGCNINISNCYEVTPLHLSVHYCRTNITHELLKRGADINAQCSKYATALHYAVQRDDLELVCMSLYYNADVYIKWKGHTPFSYAFNQFEIVEVLNNYYSFIDDDINYIIDNSIVWFCFLQYTNAEIFKAVWPKFDPELILNMDDNRFISFYLDACCYSISDWVECLYLILNSDVAFDLIEDYNKSNYGRFLYNLQICMQKRGVQSEDRIGLIYMVLGLGFELTIDNLNYAVVLYGLNHGLEPFIYGTYTSVRHGSYFACPLHAFVIGMSTNYSFKKISGLFFHANSWNQYFNDQGCNEDVLSIHLTRPHLKFCGVGTIFKSCYFHLQRWQ